MDAVIRTGSKQLRVRVGDVVRVERLPGDEGSTIVFDQVLMLNRENDVKLGAPLLGGVTVRGTVVEHGRHKKIPIYVFKRRQNSNRRRQGHRQDYTAVKIEAIEG